MSSDKMRYVEWYKIAEDTLGPKLIKQTKTDQDITKWVSQEKWMILPLPYENEPKDAKSRKFPNIYFSLLENGMINLGLVCNTIASVEKMENILLPHSDPVKERLLEQMRLLSPEFSTFVSSKRKVHFASVPTHERAFEIPSCQINESSIHRLFQEARAIRDRGKEVPAIYSSNYPSEAPVLDLATIQIKQDKDIFRKKLQDLKPLLESCLDVRTEAQYKREEAKKPKKRIEDYSCPKCERKFTREQYDGNRFCPKCGMRIKVSVRYE
jgi:DNA-directed RNA polymerase subunit RPC12/RpoP